MKKYGDDADSFHDQGTRVEASKIWHEQNQLRYDYSYRNASKPKHANKYSYKPKPKTTNKSTYKPDYSKTYYKPNYSKKSKKQHRNSSNRIYNNQQKSASVISVEEANKKNRRQKHSNYNESNMHDGSFIIGIIFGILCFVSLIYLIDSTFYFYGTSSGGFVLIFAIFISVLVSALVIDCVDKFLNKYNKISKKRRHVDKLSKSNKKSKKRRGTNFKIIGNYNKCQKCGAKLSKYSYICPHCGSNDIKKH